MERPTQTTLHNHPRHDYGGVLYLNDSEQTLNFPELDVEVIPKKRRFSCIQWIHIS